MGGYVPKRKAWKRPGGPCPECGSERCKSIRTFACWSRCFGKALREHGYIRCGAHSRSLLEAGIEIVLAPQPAGNEVVFAPAWAVILLADLRRTSRAAGRRVPRKEVMQLLAPTREHLKQAPQALLDRMEELRAFAALRGWKYSRGMWYAGGS